MITTSIIHQHQKTTDNTEHRNQNRNWVHNRQKHTTSTHQNTHTTYKRTPPTTCITDETRITTPLTPTTPHDSTTSNTMMQETNNIYDTTAPHTSTHTHHRHQHITTQLQHSTTHRTSIRNNTPQSTPPYPRPTYSKQMPHSTFISVKTETHGPRFMDKWQADG